MRRAPRRRALAGAVTALVLALGLAPLTVAGPASADDPEPAPQLRRHDRWLVDDEGRVVLVHGMNLVYKHAPFVPPATADGFVASDAAWLREHGFNGVRIGTLWAGVTPDSPTDVDEQYLADWQRVMDLLADEGIWMQLDMHQDMWHETYGGGGVPDWAVRRPAPYHLLPPVSAPFPMGYWTPEVSTVYDQFYAGRYGLLDHWASAWRAMAGHWRDQPYSMGYDLLNEPWAGLEGLTCLATSCPGTYTRELQPMFEKGLRAIRTVDPGNIVWFEPQQFAGGQRQKTFFTAVPGEQNLGYSYHSYCPNTFFESLGLPIKPEKDCVDFSRNRNETALAQGRTMNAVPLMTEFAATDNLGAIEDDMTAADDSLMGWLHWSYKTWNDPTSADSGAQGLFEDDADKSTAKRDKLLRLVRTYPQATAGVPTSLSFDHTTGAFRFTYTPDAGITAPTEVFVSPLHYPDGYVVEVDGGVQDGPVVDNLLRVRATGDGPVTVLVRRG